MDQSQLDNTIPDVLEMYNLTEQQNVSSCHAITEERRERQEEGLGVEGRNINNHQTLL